MNIRNLCKKIGAGAVVLAVSAGSAMAAVDAGVTTALGDAKTDTATIGGLALVVIIGIAALKYCRRAV